MEEELLERHKDLKPLSKRERDKLAKMYEEILKDDLEAIIGTQAPEGMDFEHVHHILFKKGRGAAQQALVAEGIMILHKYGIDFRSADNLVWAELYAEGQHGTARLKKVVDALKEVERKGKSNNEKIRRDLIRKLRDLGDEAASLT